jgi:Holliday junction DNA helicase RuvB
LFGSKSTGKTELFRRIGEALQIPALVLSKSTLSTEENFFKEVAKEIDDVSGGMLTPEPMLIFIDEVHVLSRRVQDSLLTALESDDRCFRSKHGDINTKNITFVVATTDPGKLSEAFLSRLLIINLEPYTTQEIVNILKYRRARDAHIDVAARALDDHSLELIAKAARTTPRKAIEILKQISVAVALKEIDPDYHSIMVDLYMTLGTDHNGLTEDDKKYLKFLKANGSIGLNSLAAALDTEPNNIKEIIEPYLIRLGLVRMNRSGRMLTPMGDNFVRSNL